jgi:hypothetical protein
MTRLDSLLNDEWNTTVETLSGAAALTVSTRETKAFQRGRVVRDPLDLYRLRWRIELAFKRLKSVIGLKEPPSPAALRRCWPIRRRNMREPPRRKRVYQAMLKIF